MNIIELTSSNQSRYILLLKMIDRGEYALTKNPYQFPEFERWIARYGVDLDGNYGIITAAIFNQKVRVQLSFVQDVEEEDIDEIIIFLFKLLEKVDGRSVDFWCNNTNRMLVESIVHAFHVERPVYQSHEFQYNRTEVLPVDLSPLTVRNYQIRYLDDVLNLLEKSFVDIAQPNEFLSQKEFYHEKFSNKDKSSCEVFFFNHQIVGMYSQTNGDLEYIGVDPQYQSCGFGGKILNRALCTMQGLVDQVPFLYCVDSNERALEFYKRQGWINTGRAARLQIELISQ